MTINKVLVVDDDRAVREAIGQTLELEGLHPVLAAAFVVAKDHIAEDFEGIVLTDIRMPGRDGFHLLDHARAADPDLPVILLTGEGDIPMAVRAIEGGAFGFLEKPCAPDDLMAVIRRALEARRVTLEERALRRAEQSGDAAARIIHGRSRRVEDLRDQVRRIAAAGTDALIEGAPGSGTSKIAEVIHLLSGGAAAPFVTQAAAGLSPEGLLRLLEQASGGTLFLDEVLDLDRATQFALLERLDSGQRARLVAGTYGDLDAAVQHQRFHADLALRLRQMVARVPSLKERPQDIPVLFRHYVDQACQQAGLSRPQVPADLEADLMARDWPGNARALMNEAMRFALGGGGQVAGRPGLGLTERMAEVERSILVDALRRTGGHASAAAEQLRLPRKTFYDKLARHDLKPESFRQE